MFCHQCNTQNLATDLRCIQCGASLIGDSVSTPQEFALRYREHDAAMYGRTWAAVFTLGYLALAFIVIPEISDNRPFLLGGAALAAAAGRWAGRSVAKHHNGGY